MKDRIASNNFPKRRTAHSKGPIVIFGSYSIFQLVGKSPFIFFIFLIHCGSHSGKWHSEILHTSKNLVHNRLSADNSIVLLPVIVDYHFDTTNSLSFSSLAKALRKIQKNITLISRNDFETQLLKSHDQTLLAEFYQNLYANNMLALTSQNKVWEDMPSQYVMVIRIKNGSRIQSFDGILKRKALLEIELWNVKSIEIQWRAQSTGYVMNKKISDSEFIFGGVQQLFLLLPEFFRVTNESNW